MTTSTESHSALRHPRDRGDQTRSGGRLLAALRQSRPEMVWPCGLGPPLSRRARSRRARRERGRHREEAAIQSRVTGGCRQGASFPCRRTASARTLKKGAELQKSALKSLETRGSQNELHGRHGERRSNRLTAAAVLLLAALAATTVSPARRGSMASPQSSPRSSKAPRSTPLPIKISRLPAWFGGLTTPSFSIRSTREAALL
jgi:hypothetical protein